jgi:hypothetical protein
MVDHMSSVISQHSPRLDMSQVNDEEIPEPSELGFTQGLCENICQLLLSRYMMKNKYLSLLDAFTNKMIVNIDMLGMTFLHWILH